MATASKSGTTRYVIGGVLLVVVVALVVALMAGGSSDDESGPASDTDRTVATAATGEPGENQPVDVTGEILVPWIDGVDDVAVGQPAPVLSGFSFDGSPVEVRPGDGAPRLVVFLAHWCPHCNREIPVLLEWGATRELPDGLSIIGVSTAVSAENPNYPPSQWLAEKGWSWAALADSVDMKAAEAYGVSGFPFMVLIGPDGDVVARTSGEMSIDEIDAWVNAGLG